MEKKISRRRFLSSAAIAGAGLVAAACAPSATQAPPQPAPSSAQPTTASGAAPASQAQPTALPKGKKPVTVSYWMWGGADRYKPRLDAFARLYPDTASWLTVDVQSKGQHDAEVYQAFRLGITAGEVPDIVTANYIGLPEFAAAGQLLDLSQALAPYTDLTVGAKALASYQGKFAAIPNQLKPKVWYYRKDMFEKAGIDPSAVKTYDDYMAAGKKFHQTFPNSYLMNIGPQPIHYLYDAVLSNWDDVQMSDKSGNFQISKNPHYVDMLKWFKDWYTSGIAFKTDDFNSDWAQAFADEKICGSLISDWMDAFLPGYAPKQAGLWGRTLWPEFNRYGSTEGGTVLMIPKGAKNPEAALEFLTKLYIEPQGAVEIWKLTGTVPMTKAGQDAVSKAIPNMTRPQGMSDAAWAALPVNYFGKDLMDTSYKAIDFMKIFPYDPKGQAELDLLRKHTEAYLAGQETLDGALAGAEADMKAQLGNPWAQ